MSKYTIRTGILLTVLSVFCLLPTAGALKKNQGLVVYPVRQEVSQAPGSTTAGSLTLINDTNTTQVVGLSTENFGVVNEAYDYDFKDDESAHWIRFVESSFILGPHQKKQISYSLAIPSTATPGGYDIAMLATIKETPDSTTITEFRRVASLIYLDVNGKVTRQGTLLAFDMPWISTQRNIPYELKVANQGNAHLGFDVRLSIRYFLGRSQNQATTKTFTLPSTVKAAASELQLGQTPGVYTVTAHYSPPQGKMQTKTKRILYIPWAFTALLAILGLIVAYGVLQRRVMNDTKSMQKPKKDD